MTERQQSAYCPDSDVILKKIKKKDSARGKLTVFLGAMAGVGKTFAMLQAAHERLSEGRDIAVGWIETHGRAETEKMAEGLPVIKPKEFCYHEKTLKEMDIGAILAHRPEIVIVDDLAHSNAPGSRHKRRWQDVEELLETGIHVYTAVNIQHIESLNDIAAQVTGVTVEEIIPDSLLERADTVRLIDIAPEDLARRFKDGKIYLTEQAQKDLKDLFHEGNINVLRELTLRFLAKQIDKNLTQDMRAHNIRGLWREPEKVVAGVSGSPFFAQYTAYFSCLLMTVFVVGGLYFFNAQLSEIDAAMLSLIPVILSAVWWGRWLSYFAAFLNVLSFNFLFVKPLYTLNVANFQYLWSFVIFLLVSFLIGERTEKLHKAMRQARRREKSTRAVYEFSRDIIAVTEPEEIGRWLARYAGEIIERKTVVALPEAGAITDHLVKFDFLEGKDMQTMRQDMCEAEFAAIDWVYKNKREAGRSTETLPGAKHLYLPIRIKDKVYGVLGVCVAEKLLTPGERRLLDTWVWLAAVAMERAMLNRQAYQNALLIEADKLRSALFNSISHELKTPLSAILASVSMLLETDIPYTMEERGELLANIKESSLRMEGLIVNLLDTARLESGMMKLKYDWCDIQDLIGTTLRHMGERLKNKNIKVRLAEDLPLIQADFVLLEQVLINLIDNAVKYSPREVEIILSAEKKGNFVCLSVMDNGPSIPEECLEDIFQKFYRVKQPKKISGTGLGLSICKGIVEAHHGTIRAENRQSGGVRICFTLPVSPLDEIRTRNEKE